MMRHLRLLGLLSIAMLALFAAPTVGMAQTPVQDQYQPVPDADTDPDAAGGGGGGTNPTDDDGTVGDEAPVNVQEAGTSGKLPFTGGSVPLVALIGLGLLAAGLVGSAATRTRRASGTV